MRPLALFVAALATTGCGLVGSQPAPAGSQSRFAIDPAPLPPGSELFLCKYFPPSGEAYLHQLSSQLSAGAHHLLVFRIDTALGEPPAGQQPCNQLDTPPGADALLYSAQAPLAGYPLPDGVALHLDARHGVYLQAHFLNATDQMITASAEFDYQTADASSVKQLAGQFFLNNQKLDIPPGAHDQTASCAVPSGVTLLLGAGHMHRHGVGFTAQLDGTTIYTGDSWDSPEAKVWPAPGLPAQAGQSVRWTCSYQNDTSSDLHYGNSGLTDEMCIFGGVYYPAPDGIGSTWLCASPSP
jgi:hypothetical protein